MPKVSIVLPVYNGARFLRAALETTLAQTHRDIEVLLVDDCSTDETPRIMEEFQARDPRVRMIRNSVNQRLPRSLNIGFRESTGELLTWTSDDNEFAPDAIEKMVRELQREPAVDFVYSDYWALDDATGRREVVTVPETLTPSVKNEVGACFLYTRKVYETVGDYDPYLEMVEDYDYWIRIAKRFSTRRCAGPIYLYRYHAQSLTTTRKHSQDLFDAIVKYRHGYASASKLGWTAAYFFENVRRSDRSPEDQEKTRRHVRKMVWGISPLFFVWFSLLASFYSLRIPKK